MPEVAPAGGGKPTTSIYSTLPVGAGTADGPPNS
jgi:hypothetical protein